MNGSSNKNGNMMNGNGKNMKNINADINVYQGNNGVVYQHQHQHQQVNGVNNMNGVVNNMNNMNNSNGYGHVTQLNHQYNQNQPQLPLSNIKKSQAATSSSSVQIQKNIQQNKNTNLAKICE